MKPTRFFRVKEGGGSKRRRGGSMASANSVSSQVVCHLEWHSTLGWPLRGAKKTKNYMNLKYDGWIKPWRENRRGSHLKARKKSWKERKQKLLYSWMLLKESIPGKIWPVTRTTKKTGSRTVLVIIYCTVQNWGNFFRRQHSLIWFLSSSWSFRYASLWTRQTEARAAGTIQIGTKYTCIKRLFVSSCDVHIHERSILLCTRLPCIFLHVLSREGLPDNSDGNII